MPFAHRRHIAPAGACRDLLGAEFLAAPGAEDHVRRAARHFEWIGDDAVLAERFTRQLGETVLASGDLDQFRHPAYAGDLRLVPFLEVDARSVLERSEEHTSELQSQSNLVCRLLLEKK